jgi:hypothetical protein
MMFPNKLIKYLTSKIIKVIIIIIKISPEKRKAKLDRILKNYGLESKKLNTSRSSEDIRRSD